MKSSRQLLIAALAAATSACGGEETKPTKEDAGCGAMAPEGTDGGRTQGGSGASRGTSDSNTSCASRPEDGTSSDDDTESNDASGSEVDPNATSDSEDDTDVSPNTNGSGTDVGDTGAGNDSSDPESSDTGGTATSEPPAPSSGSCSTALEGSHATYNAGPGQTYEDLSTVPWLSLEPGDVVNIFYRDEPYATNIALRGIGTADQPIIINGVTDEDCRRPIITGDNAVNAADQNAYHDEYSLGLGTVLIWWGTGNYGNKPKHLTLQNLAITGSPTSAIYAVAVEDLVVENCEIYDNQGWGIFTNTKNETEVDTTYRVTVRNNRFYDNGVEGSYLYHNLYIQSYGALYEGNFIGRLRPGAFGSSLKDRSSGTVVRYNYIEASARAIDLVETEEGFTTIGSDPLYNEAWVYGNLIVNDDASGSIIHWGYDNNIDYARLGTLHFYQNTLVSSYSTESWLLVFDQSSSTAEVGVPNVVEATDNILWHSGSAIMALGGTYGDIRFLGTNWISEGYEPGDPWNENYVEITIDGELLTGANPGLDENFVPNDGSPVVGVAQGNLPTDVSYQFADPAGFAVRETTNDLGAFEF